MKQWFIKIYGLDLSKGMSGLGPNSWGWFRILIPFGKLFYFRSCMHDIGYSEGETEEDKENYDKTFYETNLEKCKTYLQALFALFYYNAVQKYGHLYFNRK